MTTDEKLDAIETAIKLLTGQIINLRTELLVIKAQVGAIANNTRTDIEEAEAQAQGLEQEFDDFRRAARMEAYHTEEGQA